jgi:hypothetical protein
VPIDEALLHGLLARIDRQLHAQRLARDDGPVERDLSGMRRVAQAQSEVWNSRVQRAKLTFGDRASLGLPRLLVRREPIDQRRVLRKTRRGRSQLARPHLARGEGKERSRQWIQAVALAKLTTGDHIVPSLERCYTSLVVLFRRRRLPGGVARQRAQQQRAQGQATQEHEEFISRLRDWSMKNQRARFFRSR